MTFAEFENGLRTEAADLEKKLEKGFNSAENIERLEKVYAMLDILKDSHDGKNILKKMK